MTEICAFLTSDQAAVQGRVRLHKWDWKAQPDLEAIGADLVQLFDGSHCPCVVAVPDTQCDEYAVFISPTHMEPRESGARMTESPNFLRRRFHRHRWVGPRWHVAPGSVIPIYEYWQTCERCGLHREQINRMGPFISDRDRWVEW